MNRKITLLSTLLGFIYALLSLERKGIYNYTWSSDLEKLYKKYILGFDNLHILILYPLIAYLFILLVVEIVKTFKEPLSKDEKTQAENTSDNPAP